MSADQPRNRTVGCKMTDSEYERLAGGWPGEASRHFLLAPEKRGGCPGSFFEPGSWVSSCRPRLTKLANSRQLLPYP